MATAVHPWAATRESLEDGEKQAAVLRHSALLEDVLRAEIGKRRLVEQRDSA